MPSEAHPTGKLAGTPISDDETVAKMGHPVLYIFFEVGGGGASDGFVWMVWGGIEALKIFGVDVWVVFCTVYEWGFFRCRGADC
jgi:hypothetical protein